MNFQEFRRTFEVSPVDILPDSRVGTPLVSVCVQTYQHAEFIRRCLDGILMQRTNFQFEILLGEDSSNDGTREICVEYARRFPNQIRLILHKRENNITIGGTPTGRFNFVYNLFSVKGRYIALCEGDDYWTDPFKLQVQFDLLESDESISGCFHLTKQLSREGKTLRVYGANSPDVIFCRDTFSRLSLFHTSSFFFRQKAIGESLPNWFCDIVSADMALFSIVAKSGSLRKIPKNMSVYLRHGAGMTSMYDQDKARFYRDRIFLLEKLNEFCDFKFEREAIELIDYYRQQLGRASSHGIMRMISKVKAFFFWK